MSSRSTCGKWELTDGGIRMFVIQFSRLGWAYNSHWSETFWVRYCRRQWSRAPQLMKGYCIRVWGSGLPDLIGLGDKYSRGERAAEIQQSIESEVMERIDAETITPLLQLVSGRSYASTLLLEFLGVSDIGALLTTCRQIRTSILSNLHFTNRIYFETSMSCDKSLIAGVYCSQDVSLYQHSRLIALNEQERLDWSPQLRRLNSLLSRLEATLSLVLEPQEALALAQDVRKVLREPDLPLPQLRHQSVGTYCSSQFQVLLAQLDEPSSPMQDEWESEAYLPLKKKLFEQADNFKQEFEGCEPFLIKSIRYQAESLPSYQPTASFVANLVQLIVQLVGNHLDGVAAYLTAISGTEPQQIGLTASTTSTATNLTGSRLKKSRAVTTGDNYRSSLAECPVEFLLEFTTRYRLFRYTVVQLQEKLGFLWKHFGMLFEMGYTGYSMHPSFNIWRTMQKLWVARMKRFHSLTSVLYVHQFLKQLELNTERLLSEPEPEQAQETLLNNRIKCLYFSQRKLPSQLHLEKFFGQSSTARNVYLEADEECERQCFSEYTEYLVDVSVNEYSVHWCGSTQQRLGTEYRLIEKQLMLAMSSFLEETQWALNSACVTKIIFQKSMQFLEERLKPQTQALLSKHGVDYLNDIREKRRKELEQCQSTFKNEAELEVAILKDWSVVLPDLAHRDRIVDCFVRDRAISQQTGEQYGFLFDFDKPLKLQQLENLMRDHSDLDSQPPLQLIESYISNDSGMDPQHHQLEEPPKLTLGRIQSMT